MREWNARKVGAKPKMGKYYSQTLACFCCQQQCNMSSTGYNCWMCNLSKGPLNIALDPKGNGANYVCHCPVCLCDCAVQFKMEDCQTIRIPAKEKESTTSRASAGTDVPTQHQSLGNGLSNFYQKAVNAANAPSHETVTVATSPALASSEVSCKLLLRAILYFNMLC